MASTSAGTVPPRSPISTAMVRQSSVLLWYIPGHVTIRALAGDLDLVVGDWDGVLNYIENTGTSTAPVFVVRTGSANPMNDIGVGQATWPAVVDIDGDGTLRPRPSIDKMRPHVFSLP